MNFTQLFDNIATGHIANVAGVGYRDGGPAIEARFRNPHDLFQERQKGWPIQAGVV